MADFQPLCDPLDSVTAGEHFAELSMDSPAVAICVFGVSISKFAKRIFCSTLMQDG